MEASAVERVNLDTEPVKPKERPYRRSVFDLASWPTWGNEDSDTAWERERDEEEQE